MTESWLAVRHRPLEDPQPWKEHAACAGADQELFFPERTTPAGSVAKARAICATCTVQSECLEYAITNGDGGIWGNTSRKQRLEIIRRRRRAA